MFVYCCTTALNDGYGMDSVFVFIFFLSSIQWNDCVAFKLYDLHVCRRASVGLCVRVCVCVCLCEWVIWWKWNEVVYSINCTNARTPHKWNMRFYQFLCWLPIGQQVSSWHITQWIIKMPRILFVGMGHWPNVTRLISSD